MAATLVLVLAACGDDSSGSGSATTTGASAATTSGATTSSVATTAASATSVAAMPSMKTTYPLTITNCGRKVTFDAPPKKVLILNGTSVAEVESFIALGITDHILANSQSYGATDVDGMMEKIAAIPNGGLKLNENFEVPKEQTLALGPDLVISTWAGGFSEAMGSITRDQLDAAGIKSYVTPVNCAYGDEKPSAADAEAFAKQTYESSFDLLRELGVIFDVQEKAEQVITDAKAKIAEVSRPAGAKPVHVLVAFPGMSMSGDGVPSVFAGPLTDSIIAAAGGVNSFAGKPTFADSMSINAEALAAAQVDVLVVGLFAPGESADDYAKAIFAQYPQWNAAKTNTYISIAETIYLGPYNAEGIEKIAAAVAKVG